ncbi:glutaredoxin 3-like [Tubulanus polymorphus]|uniref:glutaredoxin 3-like n=1 Tax=Tubulanus polymorphus TaxID=672921 RepID=UPI003DA5FDCB
MAAAIMDIADQKSFDKLLVDSGKNLIVVHFQASFATQCTQMNEVMQELAKDTQYINVKFVKVDAESIPEISERFSVEAVPTFIFIKNGEVEGRLDGANAPQFTEKVKKLASINVGVATTPVQQPPKQDLNERIKKLIASHPVMVFMKGSPAEPRCGFSRQLVQILADHEAKYGHFDILQDNEVREGLKKYSDWPTYPQLYVDSELIGGLDIIKELVSSGEFKSTLGSLNDRLKELINKAKVMLFMKGNPETPRCGFSRTVIEIMNETGVKYETFDILTDNQVRQGLKTYSDWPTYPQLYVNGELIGGLDIIKELKSSGELKSTLEGEN